MGEEMGERELREIEMEVEEEEVARVECLVFTTN